MGRGAGRQGPEALGVWAEACSLRPRRLQVRGRLHEIFRAGKRSRAAPVSDTRAASTQAGSRQRGAGATSMPKEARGTRLERKPDLPLNDS